MGMRTAGAPEQGINRTAKTDRAAIVSEAVAPTQTISIHVERVPQTSVLVRVPRANEAASSASTSADRPKASVKEGGRRMVACEPVVSVLTEIAKTLQPGRCVT